MKKMGDSLKRRETAGSTPVEFDCLTPKTREERVDVSPCGTEGCLWDEEYWSAAGMPEPEET